MDDSRRKQIIKIKSRKVMKTTKLIAWICRFKESATKTTLDTDDFLREFYQASTEQITSMLSLLFPNLRR